MEEQIKLLNLLKENDKTAIDKYRNINFFENHVAFVGTPKKHQYDKSKIILLSDPFSDKKIFYEFSIDTIDLVEELGTISSRDGKNALQIRIWVKKGTIALKYEPFIIE
ncbi:MAG: inorganic pyrophosphatase Ppa [Spirochaetota bacterium]|nr:inorganic pyrophosphatase Ppa [Spirochaetota bacterium]